MMTINILLEIVLLWILNLDNSAYLFRPYLFSPIKRFYPACNKSSDDKFWMGFL